MGRTVSAKPRSRLRRSTGIGACGAACLFVMGGLTVFGFVFVLVGSVAVTPTIFDAAIQVFPFFRAHGAILLRFAVSPDLSRDPFIFISFIGDVDATRPAFFILRGAYLSVDGSAVWILWEAEVGKSMHRDSMEGRA